MTPTRMCLTPVAAPKCTGAFVVRKVQVRVSKLEEEVSTEFVVVYAFSLHSNSRPVEAVDRHNTI